MDCENILRKGILTTPGGNIFFRTAEIVSINPLIPQSWGTLIAGGLPQTPRQEESCTSLSAVSKVFADANLEQVQSTLMSHQMQ